MVRSMVIMLLLLMVAVPVMAAAENEVFAPASLALSAATPVASVHA